MTTWFVTRHQGAIAWAIEEGVLEDGDSCRIVESLDPVKQILHGDVVIGTLPVQLISEIGNRGGRYYHLSLNVPSHFRGQELTADQMREFGCSIRQFSAFGEVQNTPVIVEKAPENTMHICIVSEQYLANLLPVMKRRPALIVLAFTSEMIKLKNKIELLLNRFGFNNIREHSLPNESALDFQVARDEASRLRRDLVIQYPGWHQVLNATGGTKTLSTAFFMEFQGAEIIYTDPRGKGFIRHLHNSETPPEPMGQLIPNVKIFLNCQDYKEVSRSEKEWENIALQMRQVTDHLAETVCEPGRGNFIKKINSTRGIIERTVNKAPNFNKLPKNEQDAIRNDAISQAAMQFGTGFIGILDRLIQAKLLRSMEDGKFVFSDISSMEYLSGGWLEHWAWLTAKECGPHDLVANISVRAGLLGPNSYTQSDNELDLVVLHNNRLLIVECKTINWHAEGGRQEIFNKLDALGTHARGLFGKSVLLSAYDLDDKAKRRARSYGIQYSLVSNKNDFKEIILKWMGDSPAVQ